MLIKKKNEDKFIHIVNVLLNIHGTINLISSKDFWFQMWVDFLLSCYMFNSTIATFLRW